jgi:DNA-binding MarR family transcriptional regulator
MPDQADLVAETARDIERRWGGGLAVGAAASIGRARQIVDLDLESSLREFDLNPSRWAALTMLSFSSHGQLPLGRIAARTMLHPATITNTIDRLEVLGLVERVSDPSDGRGTLARITSDGMRLAEEVGAAGPFTILAGLTQAQLSSIFRALGYLRAAAGDVVETEIRLPRRPARVATVSRRLA